MKNVSASGSAAGRLRHLAAVTAVLLPLLAPFGTTAQTPAELQALRTRQAAMIDSIEREASARGARGTAGHTAVLRAGLPVLGSIAAGLFNFEEARARMTVEAPQPIDSDPAFQKRVAQRYAAARRAIAEASAKPEGAGGRVIGGRLVRDPEFGSIVGIVQTALPKCTGSYLGAGRVLTAAHCVCDLGLNRQNLGWHVAFGDALPVGKLNGQQQQPLEIDAGKTSIFPSVNGTPTDYCERLRLRESITAAGHDLAILVIKGSVPATLPVTRLGSQDQLERTLAEDGDLAWPFQIAGFGRSWDNGVLKVTGRKHAAFVLSGELCPASGHLGIDNIPCFATREVSALDASGRDTCKGDSGGPLFIAGDGPQDWRLVGVTSRALRRSDPHCGGGGIYALTTSSEVKKWLRDNGVPVP